MLATRIIPTLLARGTQLVKGERFQSWRSVGHVLQAARIYQERGVDELIVLDIAATPEGRGPDLQMVEELTRDFRSPVTVGGGVRSVQDVRDLLNAGADKVAICTNWDVCEEATARYGAQAITMALDFRHHPGARRGKEYSLWTRSGTKREAKSIKSRASHISYHHRAGGPEVCGEILLTSIDRDGTMEGYDLELIRSVCAAVDIPVIASGGCSGYPDMLAAIQAGASAVAAGALWQFTDATPREAAQYLHNKGIEVRLD